MTWADSLASQLVVHVRVCARVCSCPFSAIICCPTSITRVCAYAARYIRTHAIDRGHISGVDVIPNEVKKEANTKTPCYTEVLHSILDLKIFAWLEPIGQNGSSCRPTVL